MVITPSQAANKVLSFLQHNKLEIPDTWYWDHDLFHVLGEFDISPTGELSVYCLMAMASNEDYSYTTLEREWEVNRELFLMRDYPEFNFSLYEEIVQKCRSKIPIIEEIILQDNWYDSFVEAYNKLVNK